MLPNIYSSPKSRFEVAEGPVFEASLVFVTCRPALLSWRPCLGSGRFPPVLSPRWSGLCLLSAAWWRTGDEGVSHTAPSPDWAAPAAEAWQHRNMGNTVTEDLLCDETAFYRCFKIMYLFRTTAIILTYSWLQLLIVQCICVLMLYILLWIVCISA